MTPTIALVDDDKNILTSVSIALQAEGFLTRLYSEPEAALKALIDNPADLRYQDAGHGWAGTTAPPSGKEPYAGDLPDVQDGRTG
jgi:DNA-binding NtrC family response regulator